MSFFSNWLFVPNRFFIGHYSLPEFREETGYTHLQIADGNIMSGGEYGDNRKTNGGIKLITSVNQTEIDFKEIVHL